MSAVAPVPVRVCVAAMDLAASAASRLAVLLQHGSALHVPWELWWPLPVWPMVYASQVIV